MSEERRSRRSQNEKELISFASPIFDLVLRLKSGIVAPSNDLRPQISKMLQDFEERAVRYRFDSRIIQVGKFALAAFVDETVLTNNFPLKQEWEKKPLQLEYFGEQLAGNKFFEKLEAMLKQIEVTVDAVEIYYVCLLLGFKGRYLIYEQDKLLSIMQNTANALIKAGRISAVELSPHWLSEDQPKPPPKRGMPVWAKVTAVAGLGLAVVIYLLMFILSTKFLNDAMNRLNIG